MKKKGTSPVGLVGKWVSVVGVMQSHRGRPQMHIELPSQIQVLSGAADAKQRLRSRPSTKAVSRTTLTVPTRGTSREADVFNTLYRGRPATPAPQPVKTPFRRPAPRPTPSSRGTGTTNCFVATAVFGSFDAPEVRMLRWYRDHILATYRGGRLFIQSYYQWGPHMGRIVYRSSFVRCVLMFILSRVANHIQRKWRL